MFKTDDSWKVLKQVSVLCFIALSILAATSLSRIEKLPLSTTKLSFNAHNAHRTMTTIAKKFPYRVPWHENKQKAADWIKDELLELGYLPQEMGFSEVIAGKTYHNLRNIFAEKKGTAFPNEIIVFAAHYDTTDTTIEGAMDDASGVGIVLELARVLSKKNTQRSVLFLLTDSEEFGAFWGARTFARSYGKRSQIISVINFDFVAPENQTSIMTMSDGLHRGYTPLWLRELAVDSISSFGKVKSVDFHHFIEYFQRALQLPASDHGVFLQQGIPAFNWVGSNDDFTYQMGHYHHTNFDVAEALQVESFEEMGLPAERLFWSIDELPELPENLRQSDYWKVTSSLYLEPWAVFLFNLIIFIPFIAFSYHRIYISLKKSSKKLVLKVFKDELRYFGILAGSFIMGYLVVRLLPSLKIVTTYELFPATQKSEILYNPNYLAFVIVAFTVALFYWIFKRVFIKKNMPEENKEIRKSLYGIILTFIIAMAIAKNSFVTVLLVAPAAYIWIFLKIRKSKTGKLTNAFLLLSGAITAVVTIIVSTSVFHVGIVYWYLFLGLSYGMISVYSALLGIIFFAMMFRLFKHFVLEKK